MKSDPPTHPNSNRPADALRQQAEQKPPSLPAEFLDFRLHNKKWWLTPIVVVLLFLGLIAFLSGTGVAPFIYTLF